jgi:hypothetical protein
LSAAPPIVLFSTEPYDFDGTGGNYDYDPIRDKFLMIKKTPPGSTADEIILIENWQELVSH